MTIVNLRNGDGHRVRPTPITSTDVLIIGAGPAGASLACFLAYYGKPMQISYLEFPHVLSANRDNHLGIRGIMISSCPTNADTPRAHITNMAAMGEL